MSGLLKLKLKTASEIQNSKDFSLAESKRLIEILSQSVSISEAYLFGSGSTGMVTPDSDLDILVVLELTDEIKKAQKIVYSKDFSKFAVDWIFKSKIDFDNRKVLGGVCFIAFQEGIRVA